MVKLPKGRFDRLVMARIQAPYQSSSTLLLTRRKRRFRPAQQHNPCTPDNPWDLRRVEPCCSKPDIFGTCPQSATTRVKLKCKCNWRSRGLIGQKDLLRCASQANHSRMPVSKVFLELHSTRPNTITLTKSLTQSEGTKKQVQHSVARM